MRIFGSDRMDNMLTRLGLKEDEAIIHPWINKALEKAQQKVEARNFDIRKNILKYDNVMNDQRRVVFEQRREMMAQDSLEETVTDMRHNVIYDVVARFIPEDSYPDAWDIEGLTQAVRGALNLDLPLHEWAREEGIAEHELSERIIRAADTAYAERCERNTRDVARYVEKQIILQVLDHLWREHLVMLDHLRQVIGWRGYAQRDPLNEYKSEAFELFNDLITRWHEMASAQMMRVEVSFEVPPDIKQEAEQNNGADMAALAEPALAPAQTSSTSRDPTNPQSWGRIGRNEICPCGSGKKYKHCHGALA
jgi:preprotein translocase subunit SecA